VTDLCMTCQQNMAKLVRAVNLLNGEKSECVHAQQEHLDTLKSESYSSDFSFMKT